ncbi:hypothetical protein Hte_006191 [Hypoxylon texense]
MSDNRSNPPEISLEYTNLTFDLDGQQRQQPAAPVTQQNIDPALEQDNQRPQQSAAPETQHDIDSQLLQDPTLTQSPPQQSSQAAASSPEAVPDHVSGQNAGSTSQQQQIPDNPQPAIGGQPQQGIQVAPDQAPPQSPQEAPSLEFPEYVQPPGYELDREQVGDCLQMVAAFHAAVETAVTPADGYRFRDFAGVGEWPREVFRFHCPYEPYQVVLYAAKTAADAAIDPRDGAFWDGLADVARGGGVRGGLRVVPRAGACGCGGPLHQVAVRFMRVRDLDPHDRELRESNEVSDEEYWS